MDRPCPEEEGDLDSDIVPFVRLPWAEAEIFFEPQTGSGLRSPVPSSQEAWVAYALFFSIFREALVVERGEVTPQGRDSSHPAGYHIPAPSLGLAWDHYLERQRQMPPAPGPVGSDFKT